MQELKFDIETSVIGTYTKSTLSKKETDLHFGHYKIIVNKNLEVILYPPYHEKAIRPEEEVSRFEDKKVKVTGRISKNTQLSKPSILEQPTSINTPCFYEISHIEVVNEY